MSRFLDSSLLIFVSSGRNVRGLAVGKHFSWGSVVKARVRALAVVEHFDVLGNGEPCMDSCREPGSEVHFIF